MGFHCFVLILFFSGEGSPSAQGLLIKTYQRSVCETPIRNFFYVVITPTLYSVNHSVDSTYVISFCLCMKAFDFLDLLGL